MQHEHGVDMSSVEQWCRSLDGGWKLDLCSLTNLALVAGLNIPFYVGLKGRPPEAVKEVTAC